MIFFRKLGTLSLLLALLSLAACSFSTAGDVTPPASYQPEPAATQRPTQAVPPTEVVVPTAEELATDAGSQVEPSSTTQTGVAEKFDIHGVVTNLSGGNVPTDMQVVLEGYDEANMVLTQTAQLDQDDNFSFKGVDKVAGQVFIVSLEYEGELFVSDVLHISDLAEGASAEMNINIYNKTTETADLFADRAHVFVNFLSTERLQVVVYLLISNPTNLVVAGENPEDPALTFLLPQEAANLQFEDSNAASRYIAVEGGFGDLMSIRPGMQQHEILFAVELPYDGKRSIDFTFPVRVVSGTIVIPDGVEVKGDQLTAAGEREMDTAVMQLFTSGELPAGEVLHLEISGEPTDASATAGTKTGSTTGLAIGLGVFAAVLVISGIWLSRRSKAARVNAAADKPLTAETEENLLDAIIALDAAYEEGEVSVEDYEVKRAELKERLKVIRNL